MHISLSEAKARLTDLVRQAEAGEEVVLTRHGRPAARIIAVAPAPTGEARMRLIERLRASAAQSLHSGPGAAKSQDLLYGEDGLPG
jgi:prevent-host-death family protein